MFLWRAPTASRHNSNNKTHTSNTLATLDTFRFTILSFYVEKVSRVVNYEVCNVESVKTLFKVRGGTESVMYKAQYSDIAWQRSGGPGPAAPYPRCLPLHMNLLNKGKVELYSYAKSNLATSGMQNVAWQQPTTKMVDLSVVKTVALCLVVVVVVVVVVVGWWCAKTYGRNFSACSQNYGYQNSVSHLSQNFDRQNRKFVHPDYSLNRDIIVYGILTSELIDDFPELSPINLGPGIMGLRG